MQTNVIGFIERKSFGVSRRNKRRTPPGSASMDRISESMLGIPRIP